MNNDIEMLKSQLSDLRSRFATIEDAYIILKQKFIQIDSLYSITSALSRIIDFEELLKFTRNVFKTSIKTDSYSLMLLDEESGRLTIGNASGLPSETVKLPDFGTNGTIFHKAIEQRRRILIRDTSDSGGNLELYPRLSLGTGSFLCEPLVFEDSKILGVLNLYRKTADAFSEQDLEFIGGMAKQLAHTLNKILIYEHTRELSITDELTGIFNRRYFNQSFEMEIQRANRYNHSLAILMLDIDNFKKYNDINGHIMGDEVLKKVSRVLEKILRKTDLLARFGGEEFIIMLPEISDEQSRKVANKLRREIERTSFSNEDTLPGGQLTISVGLALFPADSREPGKLIQYADEALYAAKSQGRNCVVWHGKQGTKRQDVKKGTPSELARTS